MVSRSTPTRISSDVPPMRYATTWGKPNRLCTREGMIAMNARNSDPGRIIRYRIREVLFHLLAADARDRAAVLPDVLRYFHGVQGHLRVEIGEEDDQERISDIVGNTVRPHPGCKPGKPLDP